jgi:hypothetical protein
MNGGKSLGGWLQQQQDVSHERNKERNNTSSSSTELLGLLWFASALAVTGLCTYSQSINQFFPFPPP